MMYRNLKLFNSLQPLVSFPLRNFSLTHKLFDIFKVQNEQDFKKRVLEATCPTVVNFKATWCEPCKILEPRIEIVITEYNGKVSLAKASLENFY